MVAGSENAGLDARTLAVHTLRANGWTLQMIGELFGVSRERTRQILAETDGPTFSDVREVREKRRAEEIAASQVALAEWMRAHPGSSAADAQAAFGWDDLQLAEAMTDEVRRLAIRTQPREAHRRYSDAHMMAALQHAWEIASADSEGLSHNRYTELVRSGAVDGPSWPRILQVYGTWQAALDKAGVPAGRRPNRVYTTQWTDEEILATVRAYLEDPSTVGTYDGWDPWKRQHAPKAPSGPTLRNRLGPWSQIKRRALGAAD
jgi:hypothetical protein